MQNDGVSSCQVQTLPTSSGRQQERKDAIGRVVEPAHAENHIKLDTVSDLMAEMLVWHQQVQRRQAGAKLRIYPGSRSHAYNLT